MLGCHGEGGDYRREPLSINLMKKCEVLSWWTLFWGRGHYVSARACGWRMCLRRNPSRAAYDHQKYPTHLYSGHLITRVRIILVVKLIQCLVNCMFIQALKSIRCPVNFMYFQALKSSFLCPTIITALSFDGWLPTMIGWRKLLYSARTYIKF